MPPWAIVPLRAFLGFAFVWAGLDKLADPRFLADDGIGSLASQLDALGGPLAGPMGDLVPHAPVLGMLIAGVEVLVGVATLADIAGRVAAGIGAALTVGFWLTVGWGVGPWYLGNDLPYAAGWLTLALAGSGPWTLADLRHPAVADPDRRRLLGGGTVVLVAAATGGLARALAGRTPSAPTTLAATGPSTTTTTSTTTAAASGAASTTTSPTTTPTSAGQPAAPTSPGARPASGSATTQPPSASGPSPTTPPTTPAPAPAPPTTTTTTKAPGGSVTVARAADVRSGAATTFQHPTGREACYATRDASGAVVAFVRRCTHAACTVEESPGTGFMVCPCHGSEFPIAGGRPVTGPAVRPLEVVPVEVVDGDVRVRT